jgi:hypothetical protein
MRYSLRALGATLLLATTASAPLGAPVPGVTYRLRMTTRIPALEQMAPGASAGMVILARGTAIGRRARIDFQAIEPAPSNASLTEYLLVTDSGTVITVSPDTKTYVEGSDISSMSMAGALGGRGGMRMGGGGGRGGGRGDPRADSARAARGTVSGAGMLEGFQVRDVRIDVKNLGAGEAIDGRPTQHYMMSIDYSVMLNQQLRPLHMDMEVWTAKLPAEVVNPFDQLGFGTYERSGPAVELSAKMEAARRKLDGTAVRMITTISLTELMQGMRGAAGNAGAASMMAGMQLDVVQTVQLTSITTADVDPARLAIPVGYTKR